jgi:hypothetical protein
MRKVIIIVLHLLLFALLAFFFRHHEDKVVEVEVIKTDTIRITDTVEIVQPICTIKRVTDTILIHTTDTLMREVVVSLPREERVYEDSTFRAVVSGYRPSLDTIQVFNNHIVVKVTERITPPRWSLGLQGGVGVTPKGIQPYIGVGISYRLDIKK